MGYQIEVRDVAAQPAAFIRASCAPNEIGKTLHQILPEVGAHVKAQDGKMAGPPFSRYIEMEEEICTLEAGIPLVAPIAPSERVQVGELGGGSVAFTVHAGPYEGLPDAYQALCVWTTAQEKESNGAPWESYITDPGELPDTKDWRTEVYWPIR